MNDAPPDSALHQRWRIVHSIARDTLLEALRGRWLWLSTAALAAIITIALMARALALTETDALTLAVVAPLGRLFAVLIVVLSTVAGVVRERSDRTLLLALAAPVGRGTWLGAKALGFSGIAAATGLLLALPVLALDPGMAAAAWTGSLMLELVVLAIVTLAIASVLGQVAPAAGAALAFYVLARVLHVVLLLGARAQDYSDLGLLAPLVRLIGAIIPRLDLFTRTEWLLGLPPDTTALALLLGQALLYAALALSAALIDLRRAALT